jgi:CDGSH iron-sulfur domain-containing protein 3
MENKDQKAQFRVMKNGPLEVTGKFTIIGPEGKPVKAIGPVYLCRCGGSCNKPFCDGTHISIGFHS